MRMIIQHKRGPKVVNLNRRRAIREGCLMFCLFCETEEQNYTPAPDTDFICSRCVQVLINADHDDLKRAYDKALAKGYTRKARAIESFLIPGGEINAQRRPKSKKFERHFNRKRIDTSFRDQKERIGRSALPSLPTVL